MSDRLEQILAALTFEEKLAMLAGRDLWSTAPVERLGIPSVRLTDGPNGVRGSDDRHGPPVMSYPVGVAMGASFDPALVTELGAALGREARAHGASMLLGPTMNIPRVPVAGRNFECFSEDPVHSGTIAAAYVRGVQSEQVAACIKHVVCNDQETDRFSIDAVVDERSLNELYLEPFRLAIRGAGPWAAMSAYNTINGVTASEQPLLDEVLRGRFGFDGVVVSDWYGTYSPGAVTAGLDLEMPGPARWMAPEHVQAALDAGTVTLADIDRKVTNLLRLIERTGGFDREAVEGVGLAELPEHRALARRAATSSMVLLHNTGVLPLAAEVRRVAVIGEAAVTPLHQGGGSSSVHAHRVVSILDGLRAAVGEDVEVTYSRGARSFVAPPLLHAGSLHHDGQAGLEVTYARGGDPRGEPVRRAVSHRSGLDFFGPGDDWVSFTDFSLRVRGTHTPRRTGRHRFTVEALGCVRVWMAGEQQVDAWEPSRTTASFELDLAEGEPVELRVEYTAPREGIWRNVRLGVEEPDPVTDHLGEAVRAAAEADVAVVVVGLGAERESEGEDRPDLRLPTEQDALVAAVAAACPSTVVVLATGSPVELPWLDDVAAVLQAWYAGQEVGHAVADVLTGAVDPGGRLPITWPADSRQHPGLLNYPGEAGAVRYGEGVYVGYRAYDQLGLTPRFPFGHGLSYADIEVSGAEAALEGDHVVVTAVVENAASRAGVEVLRVFAHDLGGLPRRLVAFAKMEVAAGSRREVRIEVPLDHLAWWDPAVRARTAVTGPVILSVDTGGAAHLFEVELPVASD